MPRSLCFGTVSALAVLVAPAHAQTPAQNDSSAKAAATAKSLPLIPARTLKFTATEGTWISLDLSPDGSTILFELLGDLYTLPVAGGTARRGRKSTRLNSSHLVISYAVFCSNKK